MEELDRITQKLEYLGFQLTKSNFNNTPILKGVNPLSYSLTVKYNNDRKLYFIQYVDDEDYTIYWGYDDTNLSILDLIIKINS